MSFAVKFTPVNRPKDGMTGKPYAVARDAWHDLIKSLENDIAEREAEFLLNGDGTSEEHAQWLREDAIMRKALSGAHDLGWNEPGDVPVSFGGDERESFVYGVIEVTS